MAESRPRARKELQLPTAARLETVPRVRSVIESIDAGRFSDGARLIDQMLMNARLRAMLETRLSALTGAAQKWKPRRENRDCRRAAKEIAEDWPRMVTTPTRWQISVWGLLLGVGFGSLDWGSDVDPATLRWVPRLVDFEPYGASFDFVAGMYAIQVAGGKVESVASPAIAGPDRRVEAAWLIHEPFGKYSYRRGYARSAWYSWLGSNWGQRDRYRMSEKVGIGAALAYVPHGADKKAAEEFRDDIAQLKSGGVVVCETFDQAEGGLKYDAKPFEWNSQNTSAVADQATAAAHADLTILFLGHATQAESQGGASHDLANVGADIRSDITDRDAEGESGTLVGQLASRYTMANYGDPDMVEREVVTDPPARDKARAEMMQLMGQSLTQLAEHGVDTVRLCEEMRLPMRPPGKGPIVQAPAARSAPGQPNDAPAQGDAPTAQENA